MYCPNCGKTNSAEQKFCRACGLQLERIVQSLAEQRSAADGDKRLVRQQRNLDRWINIVAATTGSILVGAVIWGIIYSIIIVKGAVVTGSIFLAFILGVITFALLMLYRESLARRSAKPTLESDEPTTDPLQLTEQRYEPVPSVVERTTELLSVERNERMSD